MSVRNLESFFVPHSIALIGASRDERSVGGVVARNLIAGGRREPVWLVNPHATELHGVPVHASINDLPGVPELAVIATPAATVPGLIAELGARGTKAVVVLSAGFAESGEQGQVLQAQMLEAARPYTLRIVGPNCIGVLSPAAGVNASFSHRMPLAGKIAFLTQSGALLTAVVDWAAARGIGFSHVVSLGGMSDADFGDFLDYMAADPDTHAVFLYIENVAHARKFMSAARRCSRIKPVIVIKSGRNSAGAHAAHSHTGALAGSDVVYDAAFRRAGMLRVLTTEELFDTLETVSRGVRVTGDRFAFVTNGGGAGVLATDDLIERGGRLATLAPETIDKLNAALPKNWSGGNPVDIIGDADAERYRVSVDVLRDDPNVDALIVINCPVAVADSTAAAQAVIDAALNDRTRSARPPVVTSWLGADAVADARRKFDTANLPHFPTPERAVRTALRLAQHDRAQALLMESPAARPPDARDNESARRIIDRAIVEGRDWLSALEAHTILTAYGIPTTELRGATTPDKAAKIATALGFPVALKVMSAAIVHKSDVGGVALHLQDGPAVARAAEEMIQKIASTMPTARIEGFLVQPMATRPGAHELIVGLSEDELFGPVVLFGQGGTAVEVIADRAVALPPLNAALAHDLIARTRVSRLLAGYRDRPAANVDAVVAVLMALQDIAVELPQVKELDINPLWADHRGVLALDARIKVAKATQPGTGRFAIKPYPGDLEHTVTDRAGKPYRVRPIRPDDAQRLQDAVAACSPEDVRLRFFSSLLRLPDMLAKRLTQIDYDREMAFVAEDPSSDTLAGVVRLSFDPDHQRGEFAVIVRTDLKGSGLGFALMHAIIAYARAQNAKQVFGDVLAENERMLKMCEELGFHRSPRGPDAGVVEVTLDL